MSDASSPATGPSPSALSARSITVAALLAALLAACALLPAIPLGPVPITLQTAIVMLAALLLTSSEAALSVGVFLLLGAAGLPVFSGLKGGLGVLAGPTGGYLFGFLFAAVIGSLVRVGLRRAGRGEMAADVTAVVAALLVVYVLGAVQLAVVAHLGLAATLTAGVLPFLPGEVAKAVLAIIVARPVRAALSGR